MPAIVQRVSTLIGGYRGQREQLRSRMQAIREKQQNWMPQMKAASVYAGEERELLLKYRDRGYDLNQEQVRDCLEDYRHYRELLDQTDPQDFNYKALDKCVGQAQANVYKAARSLATLAKSDTLIADSITKYEKQTDALTERFGKAMDAAMINRLAKGMRVEKRLIDEPRASKALTDLEAVHNDTLTLMNTDFNAELQKLMDRCIEILNDSTRYDVNSLQRRIDTNQEMYRSKIQKLLDRQEQAIQEGYVRLNDYAQVLEESNRRKAELKEQKKMLTAMAKGIKASIKKLDTALPSSKKEIIIQKYETIVELEILKASQIDTSIREIARDKSVKVKQSVIQEWKDALKTKKEKLEENRKYCHKLYTDQAQEEQRFNTETLQKIETLIQDKEKVQGMADEIQRMIAMEKVIKAVEDLTQTIDRKEFLIYPKDEMYSKLAEVNAGAKEDIQALQKAQKAILSKRKDYIERESRLRYRIEQEKSHKADSIEKYAKNIQEYTEYKGMALTSTLPDIEKEIQEWTARHRKYLRANLFHTSKEEIDKIDPEKGDTPEKKISRLQEIRQNLQDYEQANPDMIQDNTLSNLYAAIARKLEALNDKLLDSTDAAKLRQEFVNQENRLRNKIKEEKAENTETVTKYRDNLDGYVKYKDIALPKAIPAIEKDIAEWTVRCRNFERINLFVTSRDRLKGIKPEKGTDPQAKLTKVQEIKTRLQDYEQANPDMIQQPDVARQLNILYAHIDKLTAVLSGKTEDQTEADRVKSLKKAGIRNGVYADQLVKGQVYLTEHGHGRYKGMSGSSHTFELVTPAGDGTYKNYGRNISIQGTSIVNRVARNIELGQTYLYKGGPGTAKYMLDMGGGNFGFELNANGQVIKGKLKAPDILNGAITIPEDTTARKDRNFKVPFTKNPDAMRANANIIKRNGQGYVYISRYGFISFGGMQTGSNYIFSTSQNQQFVYKQADITKGEVQMMPVTGGIYNVKGYVTLCRGLDQMGFFNFISFEDMEKGRSTGMQIQFRDIKAGNVQPLTEAQNRHLKEIMDSDQEMMKIFENYYTAMQQ